jgi:hypothetical protein
MQALFGLSGWSLVSGDSALRAVLSSRKLGCCCVVPTPMPKRLPAYSGEPRTSDSKLSTDQNRQHAWVGSARRPGPSGLDGRHEQLARLWLISVTEHRHRTRIIRRLMTGPVLPDVRPRTYPTLILCHRYSAVRQLDDVLEVSLSGRVLDAECCETASNARVRLRHILDTVAPVGG